MVASVAMSRRRIEGLGGKDLGGALKGSAASG
jgi:hypothetical protein